MESFSVVVPVYGCREALPELHRRLTAVLGGITGDYEIILVNDACPENSWEVIEELCREDKHVKGIELSRNFGQMRAIQAGLEYSSGDWTIVMDCDLQDQPEEIPRLYEKAKEGYDLVFARRADRKDGKVKIFLSELYYRIYRFATDSNYDGAICNFSIVKRNVVDAYLSLTEQHRDYVMCMMWLGFRQAVVDVEHSERYSGRSSYTLGRRITLALDQLTSQSDTFLRLFVGMGFIMTLISAIALVGLVIYHYAADVEVGWTSLIAVNILVGGLLMMVMGVVGIYVGNTFMQSKNRPLFIVRQVLNGK